jgi:LuxR family maltose regulon positive regulatory protein
MAHAGLGEVLYQWGDLENAAHHLTLGLELAQDWRVVECLLASHLTLARIHQAQGDGQAVLAALRQAEQVALEHDRLWQARVAAVRAQLMLAQGNLDAAARWAAAWVPDLRSNDPIPYIRQQDYLVLTRLLLAQGKLAEAARLSERLLRSAEAMGLTGHEIECLMLNALISEARGDTAQAMIALTRGLALAEPEGNVRLFVDEGSPMIKLLRQAESRHIARAYVGKLLVAFGDPAAAFAASPMAQSLVEPLSERELQVLRLLGAGLSTPEIARQLVITAGTVKNHLKSIYSKLDVHSRLQAVERARALSLL